MFPSPVAKDTSGNILEGEIREPGAPAGTYTKKSEYEYDVLGRMWRSWDPAHQFFSEYSYDALGNRLSYKDPKGNPLTYYDYDPLGRLKLVTQPGDIDTLYVYDSHDNLKSVTDGNGNATSYVLDDMGRVYQTISPDIGTTTYQFDPAGNVIAKTDSRSVTVNYSYDALNRMTLVDYPTDTDITKTYDSCINGKGRLCQVVGQAGTTTYTYSPKGELVQEDKLILGVNYTTGYQYDANGNLELLSYPSGRTVRYVYDDADQITGIFTTPLGGTEQTVASSISYYPFGPMKLMTHGNGLVRSVGYDDQYRIVNIQTGNDPEYIQKLIYTPDPNSNIDLIEDELNPGNDKDFFYDPLNRLDSATGPWGTLGWTYDNVGNRQTYTDGSGTTNYSYYSGTSRLHSLTGAMSSTFTYDATGNTETENTRQYVYDENSRLIQINDGGILGDYTYNYRGGRTTKTVQGATTIFFYDQTGALLGESNGVNFEDYIYLGSMPVAKASVSEVFFIHTDHLYTPRLMTDNGAIVVWQLETRPFGDNENIAGSATLNIRFPGQYRDEEIGTNYNYFRTYRSQIGRYLETDPIGLAGGPNLYSYVSNAPTGNIDPLGLVVVIPPPVQPHSDPDVPCTASTGGGCWNPPAAAILFVCEEEGCGYSPRFTVRILGTVYIYSGRFPYKGRSRTKDPTVVDASTAEAHEMEVHVNPSANAAKNALEPVEGMNFPTKPECERAARTAQKAAQDSFAAARERSRNLETRLLQHLQMTSPLLVR